jgi:ribosomal protein L37AE/L43A
MAQVRFFLETGSDGCEAFATRVLGMVDLSAADEAPKRESAPEPEQELEPDAECPNCDKPVHSSRPKCRHCGADFTGPGGWRPLKPGEKPRPSSSATQAPAADSRGSASSKKTGRGGVYRWGRMLTYIAHVLLGLGLVMVAMDHFGMTGQSAEGGAGLGWAIASLVFYLPAFVLDRLAKPAVHGTKAGGKTDH